jgi:adenylosuccinate lyase
MKTLIPFVSVLLQDMVSTPEMQEIWSEENTIQKWIDVERAITDTQKELGMIPEYAANLILEKLSLEHLTIELINEKRKTVGHLMVSFLKAFKDICAPAAEYFHLGPTTQDILDTGMTLQMREAHQIIMRQLLELEGLFCTRAMEHKDTVMMGRTHQQHAVPITFGFILATWASEIRDHIERAKESEKRWLLGNLSAVVGTQNTFKELSDTMTARKLQENVCTKIGLGTPMIDLHTRTDRFAEVVTNLAELCSSLGKMGINIASGQRSEVMEIEEPYGPEQYFSSTTPHKVNPEPSEQIEGLAKVVRGHALAIQDLQMLDNRDATRMPVEYVTIPLTYMMVAKALSTMIKNIAGLSVYKDIMLKNLNHQNVLGQTVAERLMISMYKKTGKRDRAYNLLHKLSRKSREERKPFKEVVLQDDYISKLFTLEEIEKLFDLTTYTGTAAYQTEETVSFIHLKREKDLEYYG